VDCGEKKVSVSYRGEGVEDRLRKGDSFALNGNFYSSSAPAKTVGGHKPLERGKILH